MRRLSATILLITLCLPLGACTTMMMGMRYSPQELTQFAPDVQEHIKNSEVAVGMSPTAVRYAWGAPNEVTTLAPDAQGRLREEWIYVQYGIYRHRLIFNDGKLASISSGMGQGSKPQQPSEPSPAKPAAPQNPPQGDK